ncbi:hypothetical protein HZ989_00680 [Brevundimonas sp. AJA228-03]|uniref:hypothetical protein n=1 Tax=Brevundimonas sp. AJA228-03 TaxID=2752515 RepID=UPI001ADF20A5|nr:hypothetical protein [Brevundimonas sp. AJA228-03]QTN19636.1 hypothetical protein HZ989_00680 [Brevundimonas sp. AJA228-03]
MSKLSLDDRVSDRSRLRRPREPRLSMVDLRIPSRRHASPVDRRVRPDRRAANDVAPVLQPLPAPAAPAPTLRRPDEVRLPRPPRQGATAWPVLGSIRDRTGGLAPVPPICRPAASDRDRAVRSVRPGAGGRAGGRGAGPAPIFNIGDLVYWRREG